MDYRERLAVARAKEREYTNSGDREKATIWAHYARWLQRRAERKGL